MFGIKTLLCKLILKNKSLVREDKIKDLMLSFHADDVGHLACTKKADLGYGWLHYGFIRQLKPKRVLCVGSRYGFIPAVLAQACKDNGFGRVDFVDAGYGNGDEDHWTGTGYWRTREGRECFKRFGLEHYITLHVMTTLEFSNKHKSAHFDYIYIDGNHSFEGVSLDYELFYPRLLSGGFMSFHDVCVKEHLAEGEYGVWRLWKELEKKHHCFTVKHTVSGLGIIQKK